MKKSYFLILLTGILLLIGGIVFGQIAEEEATSTLLEMPLLWQAPPAFLDAGCGTIFCDDFNSYIDGNLNGQGSWSGSTDFQIQGITVFEGAKAVYVKSLGTDQILKIGNPIDTGTLAFYWRIVAGASNGLYVRESVGDNPVFQILADKEGTGQYRIRAADNSYTSIGAINVNSWDLIELDWTGNPTYTYKGRVNGGAWSNSITWRSNNTPDFLNFEAKPLDAEFYLDFIDEIYEAPPAPAEETTLLEDTFFVVDYIFGDLLLIYFSFLILTGLVLSFIYQLTKR